MLNSITLCKADFRTVAPDSSGSTGVILVGMLAMTSVAVPILPFFAMCKYEEVNPQHWLKYVFDTIMDTNIQKIHELLPKNYKLSLAENQTK